MKRAVFLDRDGTLIEEAGYICSWSRVRWFPFAPEALSRLNAAGVVTVMVTNQSAVARGLCTLRRVEAINRRLQRELARRGGVIDAIYVCPFHPQARLAEYRRDSPLRKPRPGMLLQAARDLELDLNSSMMVGDKPDDVAAGRAAGCRTVLVRTGYGGAEERELRSPGPMPDGVTDNLLEAVTRWLDGEWD